MYALALSLSAATTAGTVGMPFFQLGSIGPIQSFGLIVAAGVLIGAALLRRYGEWHGVSDEHIRHLTGWITVTGFIGAHVFDVLAYQWDALQRDPLLLLKIWSGISSYGGFIGGSLGFAFYVWWKRLPVRLMADMCIVGLLPAFSIGRIGCTVVSDHVGAAVDPSKWYAALAMDYPNNSRLVDHLFTTLSRPAGTTAAWNLGFIELLYLIPVNALILFIAFRSSKRPPAGFLVVLTGVLYAPVRFFLDYLRPESTDPRIFDLTFAQWASILAFAISVYAAARVLRNGKPAETITKTSREAQETLRVVLKDEEVKAAATKGKGSGKGKQPPAARGEGLALPSKSTSKALADDHPQTPKTENSAGGPGKPSPNIEQPADEGAPVDSDAAIEAAKVESETPSTIPPVEQKVVKGTEPSKGGGGSGSKKK